MLPGPVFNLELLTTARRPRYYATRVVYGAAILVVITINYTAWDRILSTTYSPSRMAEFAASTFGSFAALQAFAVLGLTPTLVSGVIADERQRKTLHYLLASRLSGAEIILGKLGARMLQVFVLLAVGLPILSLLSLFGGVDPGLVIVCEVITASTAFFLASMSILVSTTAKRVRDAISTTYALEFVWLTGPSGLSLAVAAFFPKLSTVLAEPLNWLNATNPLSLVPSFGATIRGVSNGILGPIAWLVGLQVAIGALMTTVAIFRLRTSFRAEAGGPSRGLFGFFGTKARAGRFRIFARPGVGDSAMLWKELHTSRGGGFRQLAGLALLTLVLGGLTLWGISLAVPSFIEVLASGYSMNSGSTSARIDFNLFLRISGASLCTIAMLSTAAAASNGLTMEREEDTWTALLSTPLDAREIVLAKMLGAVWRSKAILATATGLILLGVLTGAVHPVGLIFFTIEVVAFLGFASALGTWFSLRSKTSWRSQSMTLGLVLFTNVGYGFCCCPIASGVSWGGSSAGVFFTAGCTPFIEGISLLSPADFRGLGGGSPGYWGSVLGWIVAACLIGTGGYGTAAFLLSTATVGRFDDEVGRPRHFGRMDPISIEAIAAKGPAARIGLN